MFSQYPYINFNDLNLDWIIRIVKVCKEAVDSFGTWKEEHEAQYLELKGFYDAIISGNFPKSMEDAMRDWLSRNAVNLIGEMVKMVFFGLTDNGYFVAYIPDSWADIIFNTTGLDIFVPGYSYGHLTLTY